MQMKPVLYLDVDGVLWNISDDEPWHYVPANGLAEFLDLALAHFEVRWCTAWTLRGDMSDHGVDTLTSWTLIPPEIWRQVRASKGWCDNKFENFDMDEIFTQGRLFVWVEDGLSQSEQYWLKVNGFEDRYFDTDVFRDPDALVKTTEKLREWLARQG